MPCLMSMRGYNRKSFNNMIFGLKKKLHCVKKFTLYLKTFQNFLKKLVLCKKYLLFKSVHGLDVQPFVLRPLVSLVYIVYFLLKQHFSYTLALQPVQFYYYTLLHTTNERLSTANSIRVKHEWKKEKSHTLLNLYILLTCALITCFALLAYAYIGFATLQKAFLL